VKGKGANTKGTAHYTAKSQGPSDKSAINKREEDDFIF
jgi:hypothetical protein